MPGIIVCIPPQKTTPPKQKYSGAQRKTGQCFALNGAIFLGSVLLWERAMAPGARSLLAASLQVHAAVCTYMTPMQAA